MERELWPVLYRLVMGAGASFRQKGVVYQPHVLVLVLLWGALHDRPRRWACASANWSTTTLRPAGLPDPATLSRRLRSIAVGMLLRDLLSRLRDLLPAPLLSIVDGMPLAIGGAGHDPDARDGHGAGKFARGYKLHAIWGGRPTPEAFAVEPLNVNECKVAERLMPDLPGGGGYILGDGEYDATGVYDATGRAGYQLLAPREAPGAGLGHRRRSPYRLRSIELLGKAFGREVYRLRRLIEGRFGQATSFGGGLARLPAWVRRLRRVRPWVFAKLVIDGVRDARNKGLMARMQ